MWEWILKEWVNGGRSRMLDQAKFIDLDSLRRESAFNVAVYFFGWLKHETKGGP